MQTGPQWRHSSVAPRRAPPCPPATLDDTVERNKASSRCFWNACKALFFGLLLMVIGTAMATIGYYADQLSTVPEVRANTTVTLKSRGFHLHNLSYAGPIVMGVGGFIVVAACVMTFEARDSAAKVVPTRHKYSSSHPHRHSKLSPSAVSGRLHSSVRTDSRRSTTKWEQSTVFRAPGGSPAASEALNRRALTAAFIQFSKNLQQQSTSVAGVLQQPTISKSPSAPNLAEAKPPTPSVSPYLKSHVSPRQRQKRSRNSLHPSASGCTLLSPHALLQRQALSMDNPDYNPYFSPPQLSRQHSGKGSRESIELELGAVCQAHGSQASMAMDLHVPNDCPVTLRVRDKTRRSDTAKRHAFVRQTQIVDDDDVDRRDTHSCSPRLPGYHARAYDEIKPCSRSTPHSRRESLTKATTMTSMEESPRSRSNTGESRRSSVSKKRYSRTNTEERRRRGSTTSDKRKDGNVSRSSSYEKRKRLEGQHSNCSGRSEPPGESGSDATPDELDKRSDTFIVIEEVDFHLPTVSSADIEYVEVDNDKNNISGEAT